MPDLVIPSVLNPGQSALFGRPPLGHAHINWAHPIAYKMQVYILPLNGVLYDVISGQGPNSNTLAFGYTKGGPGFVGDGSSEFANFDNIHRGVGDFAVSDGFSVGVRATNLTIDDDSVFSGGNSGSTNNFWWFDYSAARNKFIIADSVNTRVSVEIGGGAFNYVDLRPWTWVATHLLDGNMKLYGELNENSVTGHTSDKFCTIDRLTALAIGRSDTIAHTAAILHLCATWLRELSPVEARAFTKNPYAPYGIPLVLDDAIPDMIWSSAAVGGGPWSHNIGGVANANIFAVGGVAKSNIAKVGGVG